MQSFRTFKTSYNSKENRDSKFLGYFMKKQRLENLGGSKEEKKEGFWHFELDIRSS